MVAAPVFADYLPGYDVFSNGTWPASPPPVSFSIQLYLVYPSTPIPVVPPGDIPLVEITEASATWDVGAAGNGVRLLWHVDRRDAMGIDLAFRTNGGGYQRLDEIQLTVPLAEGYVYRVALFAMTGIATSLCQQVDVTLVCQPFRIRVASLLPSIPAPDRFVATCNQTYAGVLASAAHAYELTLTVQTLVQIEASSTEFDPALRLYLGDDELAGDDDSGTGEAASLNMDLAPGSYWIVITSFGDVTGSYQLQVNCT